MTSLTIVLRSCSLFEMSGHSGEVGHCERRFYFRRDLCYNGDCVDRRIFRFPILRWAMTKAELITIIEAILARAPEGILYCPPLKRSVVVALLMLLKGENADANQ